MKKYFLELCDFKLFFFKRNFSEFLFFSKKMLVANFMRFNSYRLFFFEKKSETNSFAFFVPFDVFW